MARRIRIVHVISSLEMGGAQAVLFDLVRVLPAAQYEQAVIYFHNGPYVERLQNLGVPVYHVRGSLCTYDPTFWWRMFCLLRKLNPDLIHASLWSAGFVCRSIGRLIGIRVVTAVHALFAYHGRVRCMLDRMTVRRGDTFIAVSRDVARSITLWLPNQPVQVVHNGIDVDHMYRLQKECADCAVPGLLPEHFVIGSVGRFVLVKRYDLLLKLFAQLAIRYAHVRLLLVGVGPLESALREQTLQLGIAEKVFFVVGQSAIPFYGQMDCFVQTSAYEGLSIALLEAMASGLPCITTGQDAQHVLVAHEVSGLVVHPDNTQQIVDSMESLVINPVLCKKLGLQAAALARQQYSIKAMRLEYETVFAGLIEPTYKDNF